MLTGVVEKDLQLGGGGGGGGITDFSYFFAFAI